MKILKSLCINFLIPLIFCLLSSCERGQENLPDEAMQGIALQDMLAEEEYWEGTKLEYTDLFLINDKDLFTKKYKPKIVKPKKGKGSFKRKKN